MSLSPVTLRLGSELLQRVDEARGLESRAPFLVRMVELGLAADEERPEAKSAAQRSASSERSSGLNPVTRHLLTCTCPVCEAVK
jgi:hypothetical protein